jgi:plasmid stabilization system protein ParE
VTPYRIEAAPSVEADIEAAFEWYEAEQPGLGLEFLDELRAVYYRILDGPLKYQGLRSGIRRVLTKRFPYAIYFAIEGQVILIVAVLHTARDPAEWQLRIE